jgi:fatty acid desaturase
MKPLPPHDPPTPDLPSETTGSWSRASVELRRALARTLPHDELKALHRKSLGRHLVGTTRQLALLALASWGLYRFPQPAIAIPLMLVQGFTIFNFTVLLHEVVHGSLSPTRNEVQSRFFGLLYAFPSGISATQFTRWHLDHHAGLGSDTADPKRHHLSPKRNARWAKLLYFTPALFAIYFRAARKETATYPARLRRTIAIERNLTILGHLALAALLFWKLGPAPLLRIQLIPYFLVFPVAFALNRLGQHYDIDRRDPAKWGTLVASNRFWNFAFLDSNLHLEHHYFPSVPFYNLPKLQRLLQPFYAERGIRPTGYGRLLWGWLVRNRAPHTDWSTPEGLQLPPPEGPARPAPVEFSGPGP